MKFSTTEQIHGFTISETIGVVTGNVVQTKNAISDFFAEIKNLFGGEIETYTDMMSIARDKAIERMVSEAKGKRADAIVGIRFTTSTIMGGASEFLAYGTAVKLKKIQ